MYSVSVKEQKLILTKQLQLNNESLKLFYKTVLVQYRKKKGLKIV